MEEKRTELASLGEFGLIRHLTRDVFPKNQSTVKGIGDDAAILDPRGLMAVWSTDMLVEGVHFDLSYVPLKHLGYKAAVANISDIAAMNARASQLTLSLAISNRFSLEALEELYAGIGQACAQYKVDLVGGDTTTSPSGLILSLSVIGFADEARIVGRGTARIHDLLCVSGDLGGAFMGLQVLEREKTVFLEAPGAQPSLKGFDYVLRRQLRPEARTDIVDLLEELGVRPTAMIDISDGLASEVLHLADQSDVGFDVYEEKIPVAPETVQASQDFGIDPTTAALNGGEDYELLFTIKPSDYEKIKDHAMISVIGHVTDEATGCHLITRSGQHFPLKAQGWDALKK